MEKASQVGVLATENEDIRSLRELIMYGLKGLANIHGACYEFRDMIKKKFMHLWQKL